VSTAGDTGTSSGGITFTGALTLLFVGLKLGHVIDWSWWWVLSPLWIVAVIVVVVLVIAAVIVLVREGRDR
jgi:hypothetical protein